MRKFVFTIDTLKPNVHQALKDWHTQGGSSESLLEYLLLVKNKRATVRANGNPALLRLATNAVLLEGLDHLEKENQIQARILRLRFPDDQKILAVANVLNENEHYINRNQATAIERLTEILHEQEKVARQEKAQEMEAVLPAPGYPRLIGAVEVSEKLIQQLLEPESPWIIALVGIGGLGKTTLADFITRQVIHQLHFDGVFWWRIDHYTANGRSAAFQLTFETFITGLFQRLFPESTEVLTFEKRLAQVRQTLKTRPYLVIIDNLESEPEAIYLLEHLYDLTQPSKFLITTRTRPTEKALVFNHSLDELPLTDAVLLMQEYAQEIGMVVLATATPKDFQAIYQLTGGNPLALKLVVNLLRDLPLPQVLLNLAKGSTGKVEDMYNHIYHQVWQTLSEPARTLLRMMPLIAESGAEPDYLKKGSRLSESQFWPALRELCERSLMEVRGTLHEKRYGIHRLTDTFLRTEIIHWPQVQ